jgi:hypothetical protein
MPGHSPIAGQWLSKLVPLAMNTCATVEELVDVSFSMRSMSYQSNVGDYFFPDFLLCNANA